MTAALRLRVLPRFPARITGQDGVKVTRADNSPDLTVSLDFATLGDIAGIPDPATNYFAMYDETTETYVRIPFQSMFDAAGVSSGYPTKAAAELAVIPAPVNAILLFGDATVGDGLGGLYIDTNNGSSDTFVSAGGTSRTWYRAKDVSTARLTDEVTAKLPALVANTMSVDNAGATVREQKTFPQVRNILDVPAYVETRTALKALDTMNDSVAFLKEAGREGVFKWTAGDYSTQIAADTQEGVYVKADAIASTSGAWVRVDRNVVNPLMFGALRGRANATTATTAIQKMFEYCEREGSEFDLLGGSWFINGSGIAILNPVSGHGRGIGYWHTYGAAFDNGKSQAAQTQLILTGTGTKAYRPHGMSSMRASGGVVANASARGAWNEAEYTLTNLNKDVSIGLFIGVDAQGSNLSGFRVLPDGGGDDGLDLYNDETATSATAWAADWDIGVWVDATRKIVIRDVQAVGHFRIAGKVSAAIPMDATIQPPPAPYEQYWENCDFGGYRASLVRGADTFQITGIGTNYVEIDNASDQPFDEAFTTYFALSKNNFSHTTATFTGRSVAGGTLRLTGVSPDPVAAGFVVGDTIVARRFGGGTSQIHHSNCRVHGMIHPSGRQCHDQALGSNAMANPGCAVEISGHRLVEVVFDNRCSIQSGEQVAYHVHEAAEFQITDMVEFNTDISGNTRGMRVIFSPAVANNTRVTHPAGATVRPCFGDGSISNLLNNNGPSGCLDLRPAIDIPSAAYALFTSDSGFMQASDLRIPALSLYQSMNLVNGLRTPKDGRAGIYGPTYPTPLEKFVYDAAADILRFSEHIVPDADATRDIGSSASRVRFGYFRNMSSTSVQGTIVTIADDATSGNISTPRNSGFLMISHNPDSNFPNTAFMAIIAYDAGSSPAAVKCTATIGANLDVTTADVIGTTGVDGNVTVSVRAGVIEIENRSGTPAALAYQFLC